MLAVVSLDATDPARLDRLVGEGRMPNLAALRERGRAQAVEVSRLLELMEPATFYTLAMGVPPETHGRCLPFVWDRDGDADAPVRARRRSPTLGTGWAAAGRRSLVIDAYEIPAPKRVEGAFLRGFSTATACRCRARTCPPRWGARRGGRWDGHPCSTRSTRGPARAGCWREREGFLRGALKPAEAVEFLLPRVEPDLLWVTMISAHVAGHRFWDLSQASGDTAGLESTLDDVYARADEGLGRIQAALPSGSDLIVVSPVGMRENNSRIDLLEGMVETVAHGRPSRAGRVWRVRGVCPALCGSARPTCSPIGPRWT